MRSRSSGRIGSIEWSIDGAAFDAAPCDAAPSCDGTAEVSAEAGAAPCDLGVVLRVSADAGTAPCDLGFGVSGIFFFLGGGGPGGGPGGGGSSKVKTAGGISRSSDDDDLVLNHTSWSSGSSAARFELADDELALAEIA